MLSQHFLNKPDHSPQSEENIVEVLLLLPSWQVAALEGAAQSRGLTTAEIMRSLIRDALKCKSGRYPCLCSLSEGNDKKVSPFSMVPEPESE